jgi:predicted site-specific integrase-resolvase
MASIPPPAVDKKPSPTPPATATERKSSLQKQIEDLQKQMEAVDKEAIQDLKLKLGDARKVVLNLEAELEQLTGKPSGIPVKTRRKRSEMIQDDALKDQIIKMMAAFGAEGMNAKQMADKLNQDPLRVRKYIKDNPKVLKRTGSGPGTKFFLP